MAKKLTLAALIGWALIVNYAYHLATERMALCDFYHDCLLRQTAVRDNILIAGLIVGLAGAIGLAALVFARPRRSTTQPATPGQTIRLR